MKVKTNLTEALTEVYEFDPDKPTDPHAPTIPIGGGDYTFLGPEQLRKAKAAAKIANMSWKTLAAQPRVALDVIRKVELKTGKKL